ncbi:MAG: response regulator transcription factor [Anaerolineae bacterium]|nr:response regulator transcription factor [Anaerolineae bacterium]
MNPIRVMIVDDHDVVRRGLAIFLQSFDDLELVGQASNGYEALEVCREVNPDIILMDLKMPEMDGIAATRAIRREHPHVQIVALTSFRDDDSVQAMMDAGAIGYLMKNSSIDELARTILSVSSSSTT